MRFFPGIFHIRDARNFPAAFISVNTLRTRVSPFAVEDWILDSGAFTEVVAHGGYRYTVEEYAGQIRRLAPNGNLLAAVSQDFMCEAFVLAKTGKTVTEHQAMTIDRYDALRRCDTGDVPIMPVLQGFDPGEYVDHLRMYGERIETGAWVGVGSVCKRNGDPAQVERVLLAIWRARPDLRLHGFGIKTTALRSGLVQELLHTADSMAWSFHARKQGRDQNDWREAKAWTKKIESRAVQLPMMEMLREG